VPTINKLTVKRCNEDGTDNDQGEYVKATMSASVTSLGGKNGAWYSISYKETTSGTYTKIWLDNYRNVYSLTNAECIFPADTSKSYDVLAAVSDNHYNISKATTASTGFTLMHFGVTGDCMSIGKVSELNGVFDIGLQTRFTGGLLYSALEPATDLNDIRTPGFYIGENVSTYKYANCPITAGTFTLEVLSGGVNGQVYQRLTKCDKTQLDVHHRFYYSSSWGAWL
jgi:hypothetical protein